MKHSNGLLPTTEGHHIVCRFCGATISGSLLYHVKALHQSKRATADLTRRLASDLERYYARKKAEAA